MQTFPDIPNLRHLRGVLAVTQAGSVVTAAARIGLTQPALTQAIARVEGWAGLPLFDRQPQGLRLNEPGARMAERLARAFRQLDRGVAATGARGQLAHVLSLAHLRALILATDHGGFRAAARLADMQPSSISRACRDLEQLLGCRLFEGASGGLRATVAGEELARFSRLTLAEISQARDDMGEWREAQTGTLSVGSLPLAQVRVIPLALARFAAEYPLVECRVSDGYYADLARGLRRAELDIVIGALRGADLPDDLVQVALFDDPLALVARSGHPLAGKARVTPEDLADFGWIAPRSGAPARAYFERLAAEGRIGTTRERPIETGAHSVMRGLLIRTDRVTLVSRAQVAEEIALGVLCALPVDLPDSDRSIGYTVRKDWAPGLVQRRFIEILREVAAESINR